jgi:hypothetical protein
MDPMATKVHYPLLANPAVPEHLIVARNYAEWCEALREAIAGRGHCTIIADRRSADRRRRVQPVHDERRRGERRSVPAITATPLQWPYVLIGKDYRPPRN